MIDLEKTYLEYKDKVYGYLLHRVNSVSTAEDLCSEVFLKIVKNADKYNEEKSSVSTWIYNITRNTLYDYFRTHRESAELDEEIPADDDFVEKICNDEMLDTLADAVASLPKKEREIIVRHYYKNENLKDIAARLGISYSYVRALHQAALDKMKNFFEK